MIEQVLASSDSGSGAVGVVLIVMLWIEPPSAVRHVPNVGSVAVINFFLG